MTSRIEAVQGYYQHTELDYILFWSGAQTLARHLGFWMEGTRSHKESLINHNKRIAELVDINKKDIVLDAGCGVGGSSLWLANEYGIKVHGITLSEDQLKHANANLGIHGLDALVNYSKMDFHATDFPSETYTVVWAQESVSHSDNKRKFLEEAYRVLKPGGRLIVSDFFHAKEAYTPKEQKLLDILNEGIPITLIQPAEFMELAQQAGFISTRYHDHTELARPSIEKLARIYWLATPIRLVIGHFNETRKKNFEAIIAGCRAYIDDLMLHGAIYAEKPKN